MKKNSLQKGRFTLEYSSLQSGSVCFHSVIDVQDRLAITTSTVYIKSLNAYKYVVYFCSKQLSISQARISGVEVAPVVFD